MVLLYTSYIARAIIFLLLVYSGYKLFRVIRTYGLEYTLMMMFKLCGRVCFYPESIGERFDCWKRKEKYDRDAHLKEWTERNFPNIEKEVNTGKWLRVKELKEGYLYRISARSAKLGIWRPKAHGFEISRFKFGANYLFVEIHWDLSRNHGTAKPLTEIEKAPEVEERELLIYLNNKADELGLLSEYDKKALEGEDPWTKRYRKK